MTVNDILAKLYEVNKLLDTLDSTDHEWITLSCMSGAAIDVKKLEEILEDYKAMLGNMKVKE